MKIEEINTLALKFCEKNGVASDGQNLYEFNTEYGYFVPIRKASLRCWLKSKISPADRLGLSSANLNEIVNALITEPSIFVDFEVKAEKNSHFINMRNGVLDIEKAEFYKRDSLSNDRIKEFGFTSYIDFDYRPEAKIDDAPNFKRFLETSLDFNEDDKKWRLLMQIAGICISNVRGYRKAFFFTGMPCSGKSLMAKLISCVIVPQDQVTAFSLHKLGERFNGPHLVNARLNVDTENTISTIKDCDVFKKLVAEEPYFVEGKGQTGFTGCPHVKLLTCGNALPKFENVDASGNQALVDRIVVLNFAHSVKEEDNDTNLFDKLYSERDVIFSVAVDALVELFRNDFSFVEPEDSKLLIKQWSSEARSVQNFVNECCTMDGRTHKADLFAAYSKFCTENCLVAHKPKVFFEALFANNPSLKNEKFVINGRYLWGVNGIALKDVK